MIFLPRTIRSRLMWQTRPGHTGRERRRKRAQRGEGSDLAGLDPAMAFLDRFDTPEVRRRRPYRRGGTRPEGLFDIRFQAGLVAFDGEEVVPSVVNDRLTDSPLGENRLAGDGDTFERQRFRQLQRGGDFIHHRFPFGRFAEGSESLLDRAATPKREGGLQPATSLIC